jgi:hypothetical protein
MVTATGFQRLLATRGAQLRQGPRGSGNRMRGVGLVLVATVLAVAGTSMSAPASAAGVDVTCVGTQTVTYQPGLLLTPQTVDVTVIGILSPCESSDSKIKSGIYLQHVTATLSCDTLLAGLAATRVFQWSNGQTSSFSYNRVVNNALGQTTVTFHGTITSGEFSGDTGVQQVVFVTPNALQCLAPPGLTTNGPGPTILSITRP